MRLRIGHWPLAVKLWGAFAALTLFIFALLAILLPWTLKGFFTEQLYDLLVDTQSVLQVEQSGLATPALRVTTSTTASSPIFESVTRGKSIPYTDAVADTHAVTVTKEDKEELSAKLINMADSMIATRIIASPMEGPAIRHFMINGTSPAAVSTVPAAEIGQPFIQAMEQDAFTQVVPLEKYTRSIDNKSIFYVIRKELLQGEPNFIVSYAWGNYRNDLVMTMFGRLMLLMVALIVVSWLPCLGLARYFTRPLVQMERHVGRLAVRDWHKPIETGRKDEFGRLAKAIESMRQRLVRQDQAQQFFLQHTSHELKTPVMVIRSYAQSIQDGIFPKGTLHASVAVIMKEGDRLEKRIRDLLLLNKLNYLTALEKPFLPFDLNEVIEDVVERLRYRRPEIQWEMDLWPHIQLIGDSEQWKVALENMLDNQLRYANTSIQIAIKPSAAHPDTKNVPPTFRISNDGPALDQTIAESLFEPFRSGGDGQFGLGLAIVKQIAEHHGMSVRAVNEKEVVAFYIEPGRDPIAAAPQEEIA
ncbi:HAMP domain-containing histidine kinase [Paenibacillus sp. SYP-B3998]|uniref:histidine kinase n=1 Tax=Paenibacillus sp. SYP-B3998 TaxID=2678564 RepID=A0A6G4A462_9BACL|nr:HAMP domain-containing sensor histidine kinase [Paenibacillus sp. SYP-B3998]NEW09296.1 HAMP domain-containing histidine kinase [Paenibacillus sp. SYP-B3998]